ncbi:MAG: hypothetical protein ACREJ5_15355 [Geminicoccaceae bacterium]
MRSNLDALVWRCAACLLCVPFAVATEAGAAPQGDAFACLAEDGREIIDLDGDHGYHRFHYTERADHAVFDARGATWRFQTFPTLEQNYPISIKGGARNGCWIGGLVQGTNPETAGWRETYDVANGAGFNFGNGQSTHGFTLDGIRIDNVWDGIRPRGNADGFHIENVWVSGSRDDCIENDHRQTGLIEDSLFEGCHMGISVRPGKAAKEKAQAGAAAAPAASERVLEIRNTLISLGAHPEPNAKRSKYPWFKDPGHGMFFKLGQSDLKLKLYDNIFMLEQYPNNDQDAWGLPPEHYADQLADCRGNILVWLGEGDYPGPFHNDRFKDCWTVVTDRAVWERARKDWIDRHPEVARLPGDPPSHPEEAVGLDAILESVRAGASG